MRPSAARGPLGPTTVETLRDTLPDSPTWAHLEWPDRVGSDALLAACSGYGVPEHLLLASVDRRILPRVGSVAGGYSSDSLSAILVVPRVGRFDTSMASVGLFIQRDHVLTVQAGHVRPVSVLFGECQTDAEIRRQSFGTGSADLAAAIVGRVVQQANRAAVTLSRAVGEVEQNAEPEALTGSAGVSRRREAGRLVDLLAAERDVVAELARRVSESATFGPSAPRWDALVGQLDEALNLARQARDGLDSLVSARALAESAKQTSATRLGTVIAAIVLPSVITTMLYAVAGLGGVPSALDYLLSGLALYSVIVLYLARRRGWL